MPKHQFSAGQRAEHLQQLEQTPFDLLIIGGGITGAGIALDAAQRGLKVLLVEKRDFAWGTSSRSTKLIHGGLRYLKQLELGLVHEVGTERAIVHRNAIHLVHPERMLLPIIEGGSLGKNLSSLGLWIYDRLAGVEPDERRRMLDKAQTMKSEPLLRSDILKGGGLYYEYRTDDARLTIEILKTAADFGALSLNYLEVQGLSYGEDGQICGAKVHDSLGGGDYLAKAKLVVNAAGPWVDTLRQMDSEGVKGKRLQLTKGVHIVVPYARLPLQQSIYFDIPGDGRMCFAIPRQGVTYIGTTDTSYGDSIDRPKTSAEDVAYLLKAVNQTFPSVQLKTEDVVSSWVGLRPLIHQEGKSPSELSRKDEIFQSSSGLISIAGGKLTGYRKMAERIVDLVAKRLQLSAKSQTRNLRLSGADFESVDEFEQFIQQRSGEVRQIEMPADELRAMAQRYGRNTDIIIQRAFEDPNPPANLAERWIKAELWYSIHYEMCQTLSDFLIRRTGRLYFERPKIMANLPLWADYLAEELQLSPERLEIQQLVFEQEYADVVSF